MKKINIGEEMKDSGIKFKGHKCFKNEWAGFDEIRPVNVIVGKNNCGKSCLLDLIKFVVEGNADTGVRFYHEKELGEPTLKTIYKENDSIITAGYCPWFNTGQYLINGRAKLEVDNRLNVLNCEISDVNALHNWSKQDIDECKRKVGGAYSIKIGLKGKIIKNIFAERDVVAESYSKELILGGSGSGATNIIQNFLLRNDLPRELIQRDVLKSLNDIFGEDVTFTEIQVQLNRENEKWEVYLGEKKKGLIALSSSGSGLKTVLLVLLNLLVVPEIEKKNLSEYVFLFEELENNLHPSLQRNLFKHIQDFSVTHKCHVFITTHSNVVLDTFLNSENAQIVQVTHDGVEAFTSTISQYFQGINVVQDLGARPSDILQANGIVWLEGPSDRVYFNKWIELISDGTLIEGRDYQCAFYGGSLLARYNANSPEKQTDFDVSLLGVNPNIVVVCDGDRTASSGEGSRVKTRASKLKSQVGKLGNGHIWITDAKEIESYIPLEILRLKWDKPNLKQIKMYEPFWREPTRNDKTKGYFQKNSPKKTVDKVGLAAVCAEEMTFENMADIFEWKSEMTKIFDVIRGWNS